MSLVNGIRAGLLDYSALIILQGGLRQTIGGGAPDSFAAEVVIEPATATVATSGTRQLAAMVTFADGPREDRTAESLWSSSNISVATVDESGLVTGVTPGTATITVRAGNAIDNDRYATATITVT